MISDPPELITVADARPPLSTCSTPPSLTTVADAKPPLDTISTPPLLTVIASATPPDRMSSSTPDDSVRPLLSTPEDTVMVVVIGSLPLSAGAKFAKQALA